jgi:hypothetical protein
MKEGCFLDCLSTSLIKRNLSVMLLEFYLYHYFSGIYTTIISKQTVIVLQRYWNPIIDYLQGTFNLSV